MEIGVFDGDNAMTMVKAANSMVAPEEVEYYGFDFFEGSRFQEVKQKLEKIECKFQLFRGDSVHSIPKVVKILPKMDLIFIDGGKSYKEAMSDWKHSEALMHDETTVFIHNYSFSGIRRMVDSISREKYQVEIINPADDYETAVVRKNMKQAG